MLSHIYCVYTFCLIHLLNALMCYAISCFVKNKVLIQKGSIEFINFLLGQIAFKALLFSKGHNISLLFFAFYQTKKFKKFLNFLSVNRKYNFKLSHLIEYLKKFVTSSLFSTFFCSTIFPHSFRDFLQVNCFNQCRYFLTCFTVRQ